MYILFARAIVTSTAPASSVFLSSYIHTVLSQSAREFALGYFLKLYINKHTHTKGPDFSLKVTFFPPRGWLYVTP